MSKAANTRLLLLQKAFELVYRKGYQATSVDDIIAQTAVTKGAFFYHFKNKDEMGLAMINEIMAPGMHQALVQPLKLAAEPATAIYDMMHYLLISDPFFDIAYGCPAINLIDEMAPLNESFRNALGQILQEWQAAIHHCVQTGIRSGIIRKDIVPAQVASFITAGYGGIRNMGKVQGISCYKTYLKELRHYLQSMT